MTMEGRRRWSRAEKLAIVAEIGDGRLSPVARKHNISPSLLFRWRRDLGAGVREGASSKSGFVPLALPAAASAESSSPIGSLSGGIEIVLANNRRVIVGKDFDSVALKRVIEALETR